MNKEIKDNSTELTLIGHIDNNGIITRVIPKIINIKKNDKENKMKGLEFITKIQDSEIVSSSVNKYYIKDDDEIQLIDNRIYRYGKLIGYYHYI